jgi:predicted phosphodiesterase
LATKQNKKSPAGTPKGQKGTAEPKEPKLTQHQLANMAERSKKYDPTATKTDCILDLRRVQIDNEDKFISRNFYRIHGKYSEKTWSRYFGTMEEYRSEAKIQQHRAGRQMEKHIAKHAALDQSRHFYRTEIEPWVEKHAKPFVRDGMKKMIVASDFHDIEVDLFALGVFLQTCFVEQPDIIVLNGDIFDQYEFSHFDKDPRKIQLKKRMEFVRDFIFKPLREACPHSQIDFIIGNHEHRILKHMSSRTPDLYPLMDFMDVSLSTLLGLDPFEINLVSKGNTTAYQSKEIRDEMAKNFKMYFDCFVCNHTGDENFGLTCVGGHTHKPALKTIVMLKRGPVNQVTTGCMCKPDADYLITKSNWQQGFAVVYVDPINERVQVNNILFTDVFVNVNGRYYFRDMDDADIRDSQKDIVAYVRIAQTHIDALKTDELRGFVNSDETTAVVAGIEKAKRAKAI